MKRLLAGILAIATLTASTVATATTLRFYDPQDPTMFEIDWSEPSTIHQSPSTLILPVKGILTSGYGWRWGRMHRGIDIAAPIGTPIKAAGDGLIITAGWNSGGYGNLIAIQHPDGSQTWYGHCQRLLVQWGQRVNQGQPIATVGSTGRSTGPHVHFEIRQPGIGTVDPKTVLARL